MPEDPHFQELQTLAQSLNIDCCGVAPAGEILHADYFKKWLDTQQHGDMTWMAREPQRRTNPQHLLPEAQTVIVLGLNYYQPQTKQRGKIARYALGLDYHDMLLEKLKSIDEWLQTLGGTQKCYVDTGPILEKVWAQLSGFGWQGKSTILIHPKLGTWLFLGCILTSLKIANSQTTKNHCGTCTRCMNACPTHAITAPYQLDARKCIAYLTIEHKGIIPEMYRDLIGDRLYGCDDCLEVCPWNRWAVQTKETSFLARTTPDLRETLSWTPQHFDAHFKGTAIHRLKLNRWLRNCCIVLGNIGDKSDMEALKPLLNHPDPVVHIHADWAAKKIQTRLSSSF
jgi:epoxyqueuosine reductase